MTTGYVLDDKTSPVTNGRQGLYFYRNWSGGDRSSIGRPTKPQPVPTFREYAHDLNLNRFRRNIRIQILDDVYSRWRTARDSYFTQLKAYHLAKAEWIKKTRSEMHYYDLTLVSQNHQFGDYWNTSGKFGNNDVSLNGTFGFYTDLPVWSSNDEIALVNKIAAKLDGGIGFHLGIAAAEADQAFRMIRSNAQRFRRIGESLSANQFEKAFRVAFNGSSANYIKGFNGIRGIADNYLLYQFGIKPLINDVIDGARSYGYKAGRPKLVRVFVGRKLENNSSGPSHHYYNCENNNIVRKSIICYLNTGDIVDESGMLDAPSIIWERLPYSFVVDWWVPVGAYLQALHGARSVASGGTQFCRTTTEKIFSGPITSGSLYQITTKSGGSYKSIRQVRSVVNNLAVPPPSLKPIFHRNGEVRLRHTLEAISLIIQKGPLLRRGFLKLRDKFGT